MSTTIYRRILKTTSIFGGVQFFGILCSVVRNKAVALLLGVEGMGIVGLLQSTLQMIQSLTGMGVDIAGVKLIAHQADQRTADQLSRRVSVLQRLAAITGLLGLLVTFLLAPWLSSFVFGSEAYTLSFRILSVTLLIDQYAAAKLSILQGLNHIKFLSQARLLGSLLSVLVTLPVYFIWGIQGIVPALVLSSVSLFIRAYVLVRRLRIASVDQPLSQVWQQGISTLRIGASISFSALVGVGSLYAIKLYLAMRGGVDAVGLYTASQTLINTYIGVIFIALATDFLPRLIAMVHQPTEARSFINQQSEMGLLLSFPFLVALVIFVSPLLWLLYTSDFLVIGALVQWSLVGVAAKMLEYPMGYLFIAKGDSIIYFIKEVVTWGIIVVCSLVGFNYYGLSGLGMGYAAGYLLSLLITLIVAYYAYRITLRWPLLLLFFLVTGVLFAAVLSMNIFVGGVRYLFTLPLLLFSLVLSLSLLNRRLKLF